jgi:hypothetical protein
VQPVNASLAAPTCSCGAPKKADLPPKKRAEADPPKRVTDRSPPRRMRAPDDAEDMVIVRRPPPSSYEPSPGLSVGGVIGGGYGGGFGRSNGGPGRGRY